MRALSTKTFFLWIGVFTVALALTAAPLDSADKKSNILLIVSDDTGYGDLGPYLEKAAKDSSKPFFISVNFMEVHQPNLPHPDYEHKSLSRSKYADSIVELDVYIGRIMDKLRELGLDKNTFVFYTTNNGAWQDVYPAAEDELHR